MLNPKPIPSCGGCKLYKEQCHCLCHVSIECPGYHEIIYAGNEMEKSSFFKKIYNKLMRNNEI